MSRGSTARKGGDFVNRILVLRLSGTAERVFSILQYFAVNWGNMTLGEIVRRYEKGERFPTVVEKC